MAASQKVIENTKRLRYVRALERFQSSIISYLTHTKELSKEGFDKKVTNAQKVLHRIDAADLYKGELKDLENLVSKIISFKDSQRDIETIKQEIVHESNHLDKSKNFKKYKRDKSSYSKYEDWE